MDMEQIILNEKYQKVANKLNSAHHTGNRERDALTRGYAQLIAEGLQIAEEYDKEHNK